MSRKYPPGPSNGLLGLHHADAMRRDLVGFGARLQREHGDVVHFRVGPIHFYQLTHPDHIQEVLVKKAKKFRKPFRLKQVFGRFEGSGLVVSDGELWSRQRRLVQPAFQPARLQSYASAVLRHTGEMIDRWGPHTEVNVSDEMIRLTLRIVTQTLFSTTVEDVIDRIGEAVAAIQEMSIVELGRTVPLPLWWPGRLQSRARRAIAFLDELVRRIIRERRASGMQHDDLLGRLLAAVDTEGDGRGMSDQQARDEVMTLLLAGHETTAVALSWTAFLLARYPEIQQSIAADVRTILGGRPAEHADLPRLAAVERVFQESMRLYPPIYFFSREVAETVEVAGYEMAPPSQVLLSPYLTHHDPRWFAEPERFDPERFAPENEERLPACAYFPFGAGPRACVGRGLAMMEGTFILASLLQRCRLELAPGQQEPVPEWQLSLHPKGGVRLTVRQG